MGSIKEEVYYFLNDVKELTVENLSHYIKTNTSYLIHFFDENDELMEQFSLQKDMRRKGFIYKAGTFHYVFINKSLPSNEMIEVLVHEIGHLLLDKENLTKSKKEFNANIFSYYVLNPKKTDLFLFEIWKRKRTILPFLLLLFLILGKFSYPKKESLKPENGIKSAIAIETEKKTEIDSAVITDDNETVYVTRTGEKYHLSDCRYVNPTTAEALTIEEAEKRHYSPCSICRPHEK